jgi:DNA polymerase V
MILYALLDCNNFYASCERVFNPKLNRKPIIVLSNNDGCVIARSQEAKDLNIAMGAPYWEVKNLIQKHNIHVFSSNYQLYGDMSERIMNIIKDVCGDVEIYSIDEAFLRFDTRFMDTSRIELLCKELRIKILQCTSVPVSIGIATTKTLAKLANHIAKKGKNTEGVFLLDNDIEGDKILCQINVEKVWGIGRAYKEQLDYYGIKTVLDLKNANQAWIHKKFGVVLLRTIKELNNFPCLDMENPVESRKNIMVSRSFNRDVYKLSDLEEAVSVYATRLGEKLRHYQQTTQHITVFIWTNPFNRLTFDKRTYFAASMELPYATSNTNDLIRYVVQLLKDLYRENYNYKKAGILAGELKPYSIVQTNLFYPFDTDKKHRDLMKVMDMMNKKYGKQTLYVASCGQNHTWSRREQFRSPCYTTKWSELLKVS